MAKRRKGGEGESEALNATAVFLVWEHQIVSVALDVASASTSSPGDITNQHIGCGSSGASHPIHYWLTIIVSGESDKMKMGHPLSGQTNQGQEHKVAHTKASKAERQPLGVGGLESLWGRAGKLKLWERWSATLKHSTCFFVMLNSSHEDPEHGFQLLGPVELPVWESWLSVIMEAPLDLEWAILR